MQRLLGTGRKACWESASLDTFSWKAWISVIPRVSFRLRPLVLEFQERRKQKNPQTQSCECPSKETEASTLLVLLECWGQANSDQQLLPPLNRPNSTPPVFAKSRTQVPSIDQQASVCAYHEVCFGAPGSPQRLCWWSRWEKVSTGLLLPCLMQLLQRVVIMSSTCQPFRCQLMSALRRDAHNTAARLSELLLVSCSLMANVVLLSGSSDRHCRRQTGGSCIYAASSYAG